MKKNLLYAALLLGMASFGSLMAEEDAPALYEQLGSTDWKVRESAQAALLTLAEKPSDSLLTQGVEAMVKRDRSGYGPPASVKLRNG